MESSNNNNSNHLQDHNHLGGSCVISSSLDFPSLSVGDNNHAWRPSSTFLLNNTIHATCDNEASPSSFNNSMIQDLRFSLPNNNNNIIQPLIISQHEHHNNNNHHLIISNQIKEESSTSSDQSNNSSFQSFNDMLSPSTTPNEMLLLNTLSPTYKNLLLQPNMQFQDNINSNNIMINSNNNNNNNNNASLMGGISTGITTFSQIFPSVNISKLSSNTSMDSSNFRSGLDLFASERFLGGGSDHHNQASNSNFLELFKENSQFGVEHDLQQSNDLKLCNSSNNNLSSFNNNGVLESKRPSCIVEPKSSHHTTSKKQRFEPRVSCPPLKVRKEKLGDRIAALQQLVAPFGKTDTASVLWETIGYIKFLQNQVETLSVPYMKLGSRHKSSNNLQRISDNENIGSEATKQDLKSRGLCLVPLTCMSYITSDFEINGGVWPPHHFNPGF